VYAHDGANVSGDASTIHEWCGAWPAATIAAMQANVEHLTEGDRVSILPLELVVQAFASHMAGRLARHLLGENGQFVAHCDNIRVRCRGY
jgi:hypothetical protein